MLRYLHAMRSPLQLALWSSREAPPQALHCSRARAPTKTRGKAGRFATLAYTAHGKYGGSLNAAFVCVSTAINPAYKWPSPRGGRGASRAEHTREVGVMAHLMITATSKTGRQAMPGCWLPARGLPDGYHSLGSASMGWCGLGMNSHLRIWCQIPVSRRAFSSSKSCFYEEKRMYHPQLNSTKIEVMQVT